MAIQATITAAQAGERARLRYAQGGPVTHAIAAMRAADPDRMKLKALRAAIAKRITADLALLDAIENQAVAGTALRIWGGQAA